MYIARYFDKIINEQVEINGNDMDWMDIPDGIQSLSLTLPFPVKKKNEDGTVEELPFREILLKGYDKYFYSKEAVSGVIGNSLATIEVAELIAGIKNGIAHFVRIDRSGNMEMYPRMEEKVGFAEKVLKTAE